MGSTNGLAYVDDGYGNVLKIQFIRKEYGKKGHHGDSSDDKKES